MNGIRKYISVFCIISMFIPYSGFAGTEQKQSSQKTSKTFLLGTFTVGAAIGAVLYHAYIRKQPHKKTLSAQSYHDCFNKVVDLKLIALNLDTHKSPLFQKALAKKYLNIQLKDHTAAFMVDICDATLQHPDCSFKDEFTRAFPSTDTTSWKEEMMDKVTRGVDTGLQKFLSELLVDQQQFFVYMYFAKVHELIHDSDAGFVPYNEFKSTADMLTQGLSLMDSTKAPDNDLYEFAFSWGLLPRALLNDPLTRDTAEKIKTESGAFFAIAHAKLGNSKP